MIFVMDKSGGKALLILSNSSYTSEVEADASGNVCPGYDRAIYGKKGENRMKSQTFLSNQSSVKGDALMKLKLVGYWVTTAAIVCEALAGGVTDLIHGPALLFAGDPVVLVAAQLGYPVYLLTILGGWKLLGAVAFLVPRFPRLKEWAYAGTFFLYVGAAASWVARGGGPGDLIAPLTFAVLTLASWALRPPDRTLGVLLPGQRR